MIQLHLLQIGHVTLYVLCKCTFQTICLHTDTCGKLMRPKTLPYLRGFSKLSCCQFYIAIFRFYLILVVTGGKKSWVSTHVCKTQNWVASNSPINLPPDFFPTQNPRLAGGREGSAANVLFLYFICSPESRCQRSAGIFTGRSGWRVEGRWRAQRRPLLSSSSSFIWQHFKWSPFTASRRDSFHSRGRVLPFSLLFSLPSFFVLF